MGAMDNRVTLPSAAELPGVLVELSVPHEDIEGLVAGLPSPERDPEVWALLERCVRALTGKGEPAPWPVPPVPYFFVYVFVAALPHVRALHRERSIPERVSRLTLADLGRHLAVHRRAYGVGGFGLPFWIGWHWRGELFQLGRLQFQRVALGDRTGSAIRDAGLPYGPGDRALAVHIPAMYGPLSPSACDDSVARAREFFPRYFPEEPVGVAVCRSWLLDGQLAEYLPDSSNIIRFQRRFRTAYHMEPHDEDIQRFVFGRVAADLDDFPRRTTLERAVVDHLRAGRHWTPAVGWFSL
jgi:GNAT-like C-terminal domain/N-acyltransferase N-terminal domain